MLPLSRPFIIFDCETCEAANNKKRIVEIGFQLFEDQFPGGLKKEWRSLVDPQQPIDAFSTSVHKITDADVADKPTFFQLGPSLAKGFSRCDFGGKNVRFDLRVLKDEMDRVQVPWDYAGANVVCADRLEQLGEPRDLTTLYKRRTGKDLLDAHSALADVRATSELIAAQLTCFTTLPREVSLLHRACWPDWISTEGHVRWRNDEPVLTFGKHNGWSLRRVPADYLKWIIGSSFPPDVQKICQDALEGRYPVR